MTTKDVDGEIFAVLDYFYETTMKPHLFKEIKRVVSNTEAVSEAPRSPVLADHVSESESLVALTKALLTLRGNKPNDKSNTDRVYAVTITETEKVVAYFEKYAAS